MAEGVPEHGEYRVSVNKISDGFIIAIRKRIADAFAVYCMYTGGNNWTIHLRSQDPQLTKAFIKKYGRRPSEELSIHLAEWHKKTGGLLHYSTFVSFSTSLPKDFMHPRYADMKPILKTPKTLLTMKLPKTLYYKKPKLERISNEEAMFKKWFRGKRPR